MRNLAFVLLALAACGGDDHQTPVDGKSVDSRPIDAAIDAPPQITGPIIGVWVRGTNPNPTDSPDSLTFASDGTVTAKRTGSADEVDMFTLPAAGRLKIHEAAMGSNAAQDTETDYAVDATHLLVTAFIAQGTVTGFVGTWKNTTIQTSGTQTITVVINADNTASLSTGGTPIPGTVAAVTGGIKFTSTTPTGITLTFQPLGTNAIGPLLFDKQP